MALSQGPSSRRRLRPRFAPSAVPGRLDAIPGAVLSRHCPKVWPARQGRPGRARDPRHGGGGGGGAGRRALDRCRPLVGTPKVHVPPPPAAPMCSALPRPGMDSRQGIFFASPAPPWNPALPVPIALAPQGPLPGTRGASRQGAAEAAGGRTLLEGQDPRPGARPGAVRQGGRPCGCAEACRRACTCAHTNCRLRTRGGPCPEGG